MSRLKGPSLQFGLELLATFSDAWDACHENHAWGLAPERDPRSMYTLVYFWQQSPLKTHAATSRPRASGSVSSNSAKNSPTLHRLFKIFCRQALTPRACRRHCRYFCVLPHAITATTLAPSPVPAKKSHTIAAGLCCRIRMAMLWAIMRILRTNSPPMMLDSNCRENVRGAPSPYSTPLTSHARSFPVAHTDSNRSSCCRRTRGCMSA